MHRVWPMSPVHRCAPVRNCGNLRNFMYCGIVETSETLVCVCVCEPQPVTRCFVYQEFKASQKKGCTGCRPGARCFVYQEF